MKTKYNTAKNGPKRAAAPKPGARHSLRPTAYSLQPTACGLQPTASSLQPTACGLQPNPQRGAALILAIAIMTVLLAIALTFYAVSRAEVDNATNVRNRVQADLLVDSALAMAMAELNRDFLKHPNATSTDFKPFALFNGSWAAGKQWALRNGVPLQAGGVPLVNMTAMPEIRFLGGRTEQMFSGIQSQDWLYYPRFEGATPHAYANVIDVGTGLPYSNIFNVNDPNRAPFVTPAFYGPSLTDGGVEERYPLEWIHTWTDVDNDGDGQNDAIWIPIPQDRFFSGGEVVNDVTGARMFDDDIDNDLDGDIDEAPERNGAPMELGSFVYWGGNDGLDNDGDGLVDEQDASEQKYFLTAPLPGVTIPIDFNADGIVPDYVPNAAGELVPLTMRLPATINVAGVGNMTAADVDVIDNDLDMLINNYKVYAYVVPGSGDLEGFRDTGVPNGAGGTIIEPVISAGRNDSIARLKEYERINIPVVFGDPDTVLTPLILPVDGVFGPPASPGNVNYRNDLNIPSRIVITHSGEPVCDLAGRAAITVRDESGKMNMNVAGGHHYDPRFPVLPATQAAFPPLTPAIYRSLGEGLSTAEIETRVLPDVGVRMAARFWTHRTGAPTRSPATWDASVAGLYGSDVIYPGYGRVDDNANILVSAFNGRDDDGDGLIDEGLYLPPISDMTRRFLEGNALPGDDPAFVANELTETRYEEYYAQLGAFEGVDEPGELQRYRPLPNLLAEGREPHNVTGFTDLDDNDRDGSTNERGELGDLQLQNLYQMTDIFQVGEPGLRRIAPMLTAFSTDRNVTHIAGSEGIRAISKLDFNFATPQEIAANLLLANPIESVTARTAQFPNDITRSFADGLRQSDVHIRSTYDPPNGLVSGLMWVTDGVMLRPTNQYFAADPVLQAMQAAVDIVDNRDANHSRSELITERQKATPQSALESGLYDPWPDRLGVRERIEESAYLPLGEIEDHLRDTMGINRKLAIRDDWWMFAANVAGENGGTAEERNISYTTSGNEAIKINEIMVRAVRRVEAEAVPDPANLTDVTDPMFGAEFLLNFDPTPFGDGTPGLPDILPSFSVARQAEAGSWTLVNGGTLGESTYLEVNTNTGIVEFTINETSGLPAGRYYLTVNTSDGANATVVPTTELDAVYAALPILQSAIKYRHRTAGGPSSRTIIEDVLAGVSHFVSIENEHVGGFIPGAPRSWAFVDGTRNAEGSGDLYHLDGLPDDPPPPALPVFRSTEPVPGVQTFTVTVPPDGSNYELRIAFRMNRDYVDELIIQGHTRSVAINALDFSQEPDHEWLELVNVSDETVNLGGWEMEVGIPDRPSVPRDPFKSTWRIPQGTEIAPRGMVLLAFNKFDNFRNVPANHRIADNGMGLADGDPPVAGPPFEDVLTGRLTVPPINDNSLFNLTTDPLYDPTGSVFRRLTDPSFGFPMDYLDNDGDGRTAFYAANTDWNGSGQTAIQEFPGLDNLVEDIALASSKDLGTALTSAYGNFAWDRIIQLEETSVLTSDNPFSASPSAKRLLDVGGVDDVAALVLRGGVFPNYPEQDGIDNDGDGAYLTAAGVYIPGTLDLDMVDNNLDLLIDEWGLSQFITNPRLSEGVDEGFGVGAGEYLPGTLPVRFYNDRSLYPDPVDYANFDPGSPVLPLAENPFDGSIGIDSVAVGGVSTTLNALNAPYLGSDDDPLDWKVFVERRWYPGDNVIVTLYEGSALNGNVADRVTYREYDVINRTIDDIVEYPIDTIPDGTNATDSPWTVNPDYPTIWPPNQMGVDFYRSLERKHPLYNGDRFGTSNRWEATDGNYDDWADSISFFEDELATATFPGGATPIRLATNRAGNVRPRFLDTHPSFPNNPNAFRNRQLFAHAIWGSPLRMNTAMRRGENPPDLELITDGTFADVRQFPNIPGFSGPFDYFRTHEDGDFNFVTNPTPTLPDQRWNLSRAVVANRPYQSPADLMRVPHQVYMHDAINTGNPTSGYLRDMTMLNLGLRGDLPPANLLSYHQDIALRAATLGQDTVDAGFSPNLLAAAVNSMSNESIVLTVGQADFRPIRPYVNGTDLLEWVDNPGSGNADDLLAPGTWAPVFLFGLPRDLPPLVNNVADGHFPNYPPYMDGTPAIPPIPLHFLFNTGNLFDAGYLFDVGNFGGANAYNNNMADRWPLEKRTAMFISENRGPVPPEGLFTWDGEDGLENGEYVLYIGTFLPKMRERIEEAAKVSVAFPGKTTPKLLFGGGTNLVLDDGRALDVDPVTKSILTRDPTNPRAVGQVYDPVYAIDVITDPTEARGQAPQTGDPSQKPPGLIHPDDWTPPVQYKADADGYIFYGNNAAGGWKPQIVTVTDNFLAVRVRNVGTQGQIGVITHVVLAPRKRTPGRVNVNTADSRVVTSPLPPMSPDGHEYFSTLLGLPGVVDVARTVLPSAPLSNFVAGAIPPDADIALMNNATLPVPGQATPWTPPGGPPTSPPQYFYDGLPIPPTRNHYNEIPGTDTDLLVPNTGLSEVNAHRLGAFRLNAMILGGRTEHADGRYYESVGSLALDGSGFDYNYVASRADRPNLAGGLNRVDGVEDAAIYPLSNEANPAKRFDEVQARFRRLGNLVTTRSDVYEIIITVEAGYGVDRDGDGFINYRSADEFVTTARTKATAIYERRTPSGQSEGQE